MKSESGLSLAIASQPFEFMTFLDGDIIINIDIWTLC